ALARAGRTEEAVEALKRAVELEPRLTLAHVNLGQVYLAENLLEEARRSFEKVLELQPDQTVAQYNLAVIHHRLGQSAQARDYLKKVKAADFTVDPELTRQIESAE
ncbi:MAG: tetratricopeptide repeat protein, partial [Deltaproteobacteria bacterium]|nr:tetratricopeptide repeat protein [Deltaproteobacteria bacterium]